MECISPIWLRASKSIEWEGLQRTNLKETDARTVPCGRCIPCKSNKRVQWAFRIYQQFKDAQNGYFITLTYNDDNLPVLDMKPVKDRLYDSSMPVLDARRVENLKQRNIKTWYDMYHYTEGGIDHEVIQQTGRYHTTVWKKDLQLFMKRLREFNRKYSEKKIITDYDKEGNPFQKKVEKYPMKYYAVSEYGGKTGRPHYHGIIMNITPRAKAEILELWNRGNVQVDECNEATIMYTTKYMLKDADQDYKSCKTFSLCSKGLGNNYLNKKDGVFKDWHEKNGILYTQWNGKKLSMPRYYADNLFKNKFTKLRLQWNIDENKQKELWKLYTQLRADGVHDPASYLETVKLGNLLKYEKQFNKNDKL